MAVHLSDGSAITVTADHPFWVVGGPGRHGPRWLQAGQLRRGDHLRTASGTDVRVTGLRYNVGHAVVYTLSVARDHTFFVGSARVLVHNATCPVPLRFTAKDLIHVIYRHLNSSELAQALAAAGKVSAKDLASSKPAGQFLPGITSGELRQLIIEAFNEANRLSAFESQGADYVANIMLDRSIGRTIAGTLTKTVRIIVRADGTIRSIYPLG
jgi:hypothetical protein